MINLGGLRSHIETGKVIVLGGTTWTEQSLRPGLTGLAVLLPAIICAAVALSSPAISQVADVDTTLVVSIDVSNSVDDKRYRLQMEGIAAALEDQGVQDAILNGPRGGILISLVTWADRPQVAVPWTRVGNKEEALKLASQIRNLPRYGGQFTCMGRMLRYLTDKVLPQAPAKSFRTLVDVSGDGSDNCNPTQPITDIRDELVSYGTTVNGLPILEGSEADTLEGWYRENVKGGSGSFILPANGFEDFGRAIRQKFVIEISGRHLAPSGNVAAGPNARPTEPN